MILKTSDVEGTLWIKKYVVEDVMSTKISTLEDSVANIKKKYEMKLDRLWNSAVLFKRNYWRNCVGKNKKMQKTR